MYASIIFVDQNFDREKEEFGSEVATRALLKSLPSFNSIYTYINI